MINPDIPYLSPLSAFLLWRTHTLQISSFTKFPPYLQSSSIPAPSASISFSVVYFVDYVNFFSKPFPFCLSVIIAYYLMFCIFQSLVYAVYYINSFNSQNNPVGLIPL